MANLLQNPTPRMASALQGPRLARDRAVVEHLARRDRHFGLNQGRRAARARGLGTAFDAVMMGLAPIVSTNQMLDAWEARAAAERRFALLERRVAAREYWDQAASTAQARYQETINSGACGGLQGCLDRAARGQWGTRLPASGTWSGTPGDSVWTPDAGTPAAQAVADADTRSRANGGPGVQGVRYRQGHPDFGPFSSANVRITNMRGDTGTGPNGDFGQARRAASQRYGSGWDPRAAETGRTWHHHQNGTNMQLVDSRIHSTAYPDPGTGTRIRTGGAVHTGGASMARSRSY